MGLHKLTAGDGYTYLTRQVAAHDSTEERHTGVADYYAQRGESPGRWFGAGLAGLDMSPGDVVTAAQMEALFGAGRHPDAQVIEDAVLVAGGSTAEALAAGTLGRPYPVYDGVARPLRVRVTEAFHEFNLDRGRSPGAAIPAEQRARIRTEVARSLFAEKYGRPAADARELSGFIARSSRPATTAVAGYDLTFSPVKSVSALWAVAPPEVSTQVQAAHDAAVADTMRWLEAEAAYTRTGSGGVRQVDVRGLVAAAFTHRDSRSGDPDLHTHVAVSNKVQTLDGRWFALDGRVLYKANVAASERYNTRLEAELTARLGVRFADRDTADGKRPVREVVGVDPRLNAHWSTRRAAIDTRRGQLAAKFGLDHGRPPTPVEAIGLAQQATLESRDAKHEPRSEADQRATWRRQAQEVLGTPDGVDAIVAAALGQQPRQAQHVNPGWVEETATRVVQVVQESRATWQTWHVRAEAERRARAAGICLSDLDAAVRAVVDRALSSSSSIPLGAADPVVEPAVLRRRDGSSVYTVAGAQAYTSRPVIAAEQRLLALAQTDDGPRVSESRVGIALAEFAANGVQLSRTQAAMVSGLACSGARLQLALAPAGTGKTTAMRVLSRAWTGAGGHVIGLAPTAHAASELARAIGFARCDTLAKLCWSLRHGSAPDWVAAIGPRTLVIIDEAGLAGTLDLATAADYVASRGGVVRLVGDDQQLASVAAGGILRDITDTVAAATLTEVHRFTDPAEAAATLALRAGDPTAVAFYTDNSRIHVGDPAGIADQAYRAWAADRAAGYDSVLLAPTRTMVADLNTRARTDRLATTNTPTGRSVRLGDGTNANSGDVVVTRRNNRQLSLGPTDWVKNGDRWTIRHVEPDGAVVVRHQQSRRTIALPADYVSQHVRLGYATTVHGAEGITADTTHTVVAGTEHRQLLYVAMTRGRNANHIYVPTTGDGDPHTAIRPETLRPPTAVDVLTTIVARDGSQRSATTTAQEAASPASQLTAAVGRYRDALAVAAEHVVGNDRLATMDHALDTLIPRLSCQPAYPTLRSHLALRVADDDDPVALVTAAARARELGSADDTAAVLDWRIRAGRDSGDGPLPWLPAIPHRLSTHPDWGTYLHQRADQVTALADDVHSDAVTWTAATAPAWAAGFTDDSTMRLRGDLAVWRAAFDVPDHDPRPTGPPQPATDAAHHQTRLNHEVTRTLHHDTPTVALGRNIADRLPPEVLDDPYWPRLADRLTALHRDHVDIDGLVQTASSGRPLPDEQPAAALWWRMVGHLGHDATNPTESGRPTQPTRASVDTEELEQPAVNQQPAALGIERWHALAEAIDPRLTRGHAWPRLVGTLEQAHKAGYDVTGELPRLATEHPLPTDDYAPTELRYRLINAAKLPPPPMPYVHSALQPETRARRPTAYTGRDISTQVSPPR